MSRVLYSVEKQKRLLVPLHSLRLQLPIMMSTESRRRHALCALHFHSDLKKEKLYNIRYIDNILKIQTIILQASKLIFLQYSKTYN